VFSLSGGAVHQFKSDLDNQGDFSSTRWFTQGSVGYAWDRDTSVSLALGGGETRYDFSDDTSTDGDTSRSIAWHSGQTLCTRR